MSHSVRFIYILFTLCHSYRRWEKWTRRVLSPTRKQVDPTSVVIGASRKGVRGREPVEAAQESARACDRGKKCTRASSCTKIDVNQKMHPSRTEALRALQQHFKAIMRREGFALFRKEKTDPCVIEGINGNRKRRQIARFQS